MVCPEALDDRTGLGPHFSDGKMINFDHLIDPDTSPMSGGLESAGQVKLDARFTRDPPATPQDQRAQGERR